MGTRNYNSKYGGTLENVNSSSINTLAAGLAVSCRKGAMHEVTCNTGKDTTKLALLCITSPTTSFTLKTNLTRLVLILLLQLL